MESIFPYKTGVSNSVAQIFPNTLYQFLTTKTAMSLRNGDFNGPIDDVTIHQQDDCSPKLILTIKFGQQFRLFAV